MRTLAILALGATLLACSSDEPEVELVPATTVECPATDGRGFVLLVDGKTDSYVCDYFGAALTNSVRPVISGYAACSASVPEVLVTLFAQLYILADGHVLGTCSISEVSSAHTFTASFDPEAVACTLPSYDTSANIVIQLTEDEGLRISGGITGTMDCSVENYTTDQ